MVINKWSYKTYFLFLSKAADHIPGCANVFSRFGGSSISSKENEFKSTF